MAGSITIINGGGSELMDPATRIKSLQHQIDSDLNFMQFELLDTFKQLCSQIEELEKASQSRPGVQQALEGIRPQAERWCEIFEGVVAKNTKVL